MKRKFLIKTNIWLTAVVLLMACASEDTVDNKKSQQPSSPDVVTTFTGWQPKANTQAKTRTTASHLQGGIAQVFWEYTDKIWVKADDGVFYQSAAAKLRSGGSQDTEAHFDLTTGSYTMINPEVHYTGTAAGSDANHVIIASQQPQYSPNNFQALGRNGDCGSAIAVGDGGTFHEFTLEHKASYLCFLPRCMNTELNKNIKLTKIVVKANKPIAGTYDFSDGSLIGKTPTNSSNTITAQVGPFLLNNKESLEENGTYMIIAPGTYNLTIEYTLSDQYTNASTTISKNLNNFVCPEGKIKEITANLTPGKLYAPTFCYWDAQDPLEIGSSYPAYGTSRYYHVNGFAAFSATQTCVNCPNVNELCWYVLRGDPHLVHLGEGIYHGHLINAWGVLIKKKAAIIRDNPDITAERFVNRVVMSPGVDRDWREDLPITMMNLWNNSRYSVSYSSTPIINADDYFVLPILGDFQGVYGSSFQYGECNYWSSTAYHSTMVDVSSFALKITKTNITVTRDFRGRGYIAQPFE